MPRFTQALKTGVRIMGGADVAAFNLTYMANDSKHRAGDFETIVIPYIELGRANSCAVSFGDEFSTVSRRHAAIERQNKEYVIRHIGTNTTLVNGRPVQKEWFLTNGDIVQLSMEGPRLRFNVSPTGTGKMASTQKMKLLAQQLVRPYKAALMGLAAVLILAVSTGGYFMSKQGKKIEEQDTTIMEQQKTLAALAKKADENAAEYRRSIAQQRESIKNIQKSGVSVKDITTGNLPIPPPRPVVEKPIEVPPIVDKVGIPEAVKEQIYLIRVKEFKVILPSGKEQSLNTRWSGTGFLLSDGKFVTARHVIQAWRFIGGKDIETGTDRAVANLLEQFGGKVKVTFIAESNKNKFEFTNEQFTYDDSGDQLAVIEDGSKFRIAHLDDKDWTYCTCADVKSTIRYDKDASKQLKASEDVHVLGYSLGDGLQERNLKPLYSKSTIAKDGLTNNVILVTNRSFESGNSGGPVFIKRGEEYIAIGIVSASRRDGDTIGIIVPIAAIR